MKCIIYKIFKHGDSNVYIGSTSNYKRRMIVHKSNCNNENSNGYNLFLYQYIRQNAGWDTFTSEILHECEVQDKYEKMKIEGQWMAQYEHRLNKQNSWGYKDKKENVKKYHEENKDAINEQKKKYYEQNKDAINEQKKKWYQQNKERIKQKVQCPDCSKMICKRYLARHRKGACKNK